MRMHAYTDEELDAHLPVAVESFSLLADATRVRIVLALRDGEQSVGVLAEEVGKSQAAVSQHLAKLRMSRVVSTRQDGNRVFYSLANQHALELVEVAFNQAEHAVDAVVRHSDRRSEEHTSELQSLMRISYAVFCLKKKHRERDNILKLLQMILAFRIQLFWSDNSSR